MNIVFYMRRIAVCGIGLLCAAVMFTGCAATTGTQADAGHGGTRSAQSPDPGREQRFADESRPATEALQAGHYERAVDLADKTIAASPENGRAYSVRGLARALDGDTAGGLSDTKHAYELNPHDAANFYNMAMVYKLVGDLDESKRWFERVLETDPNNTWSIYGIATIYADQGHDSEALDWLGRAVASDPAVKAAAAEQDHFLKYHGQERFESLIK